jgi:hypothetical protein
MIYKHVYRDMDPFLQQTLGSPDDIISFENYCKHLNISKRTPKIHSAKIFPVNIIWLLEFVERLDPKNFLTPEIKLRINAGKAILVLNHSHERTHKYSNPFYVKIWNTLFDKLKKAGIDSNRIVFVSGDVCIEENFKKHNDNFRVVGIDTMEIVYKLWSSFHETTSSKFSLNKDFDYLFLNGVPREHRCVIRYLLKKENLLDKSINSWVIGNKRPELNNIQTYIKNANLNIDANEVFDFSLQEKTLDSSFDNLRAQGFQNMIPQTWLDQTSFSFIIETDYREDVLLVSEKTYKPILYKHPFMVHSHPNHLLHLKKVGYETYSELFDETYDQMNEKNKIAVLINNIKQFKDNAAGKEKLIEEKLEFNKQHFLSQPCAKITKKKLLELFE